MARPEDQNEENKDENLDNSDDSFGLPEIDYEPLKREDPFESVTTDETLNTSETEYTPPEPILDIPSPPIQEVPKEEQTEESGSYYEPSYSYSYEEERPAIWPKILIVVLLLAVAGGGAWYFLKYKPAKDLLEAKRLKEQNALNEAEERRLAEEEERRKAEEAAKVTPPVKEELPAGTIQTLSGRTGKYYVVVSSAIDGDLIMDFAKKLSKKGVTSKIIPPYGKVKFHRLTIAEGDTYANAQATADGMKGGDYGDKLWVIHY